jgi:hypothetical protein
MDRALVAVGPPQAEIFRIGWRGDPLSPPSWDLASAADGTSGNRFDDPSAAEGRPAKDRFRCLDCGTTEDAAFGETLAKKRVSISVLATLAPIDDDEPVDTELAGAAIDMADPTRPRGLVTAEWQSRRQIGRTTLRPDLRFADVGARQSCQYLRYALATIADALGIDEVDSSTMMNPNLRSFTQACSRHIYELHDGETPRYAGIRYLSRLDPVEWECWAIFLDRLQHTPGFHRMSCPIKKRSSASRTISTSPLRGRTDFFSDLELLRCRLKRMRLSAAVMPMN